MSEERRVVGTEAKRADGIAKVTGAARYTVDLTAPGMAHAVFIRSTRAHAKIVRIDREAAESRPGVLAGEPVVKNTRIPARLIADLVRQGVSHRTVRSEYDLTREQLREERAWSLPRATEL